MPRCWRLPARRSPAAPNSSRRATSCLKVRWSRLPIGASQDQVLIVLGTPSTVATLSGEVFYYISQRTQRRVAFMDQSVTDQRVLAVYFDKNRQVQRVANYGLQDGKVFDFISRTTPTSGQEISYLTPIFRLIGGSKQ